MNTLAQFSLEDAQKIAEESDYAFAASETDCNHINWGDAAAFVLEGYKACLAELTRWNDPNDIPDNDTPVIICTSPGIYYIAAYDKHLNNWFTGNGSFNRHEIIGWREIQE